MNPALLSTLVISLLATAAAPSYAAGKKVSKRARSADVRPKKEPVQVPVREPEPERPPAPPPTVTSARVPAPAAATDAPDKADGDAEPLGPISVAPVLGYASATLKLGVGARAGYTFPNRLYVGGAFVYHLGTSDETTGRGGKVESSVHFFYTGAEVGYDVPVGPVVLRPYGGVGAIFATVSLTTGGQSQGDTSASLAVWPGFNVAYAIPRTPIFVGVDTKLILATKGADPSFGLFATGGMRF